MKKILILLFIFITISIFSERIYLNDGQVFIATLKSLDKKTLTFITDGFGILKRPISDILKIEADTTQYSFTILNVKIGNEPYKKVYLIKMTNNNLYYKNINDEELLIENFKYIKDIKLLKPFEVDNPISKNWTLDRIKNDNGIDFSSSLYNLIKYIIERKSNSQIDETTDVELKKEMVNYDLFIKSVDFYDLFWARIYKYIEQEEKELIWNLLTTYSLKEKDISIAYGNMDFNDKENRDEFDNIIKKLKYDFYKRVERIILLQL